MNQIRQGDILLEKVDVSIPNHANVTGEVVLAEGELTGHAHRLKAQTILEWEANGQRYIRIESDEQGELSHEDHDPVPVKVVEPKTTYRIVPQKEWDLQGQWRQVVD